MKFIPALFFFALLLATATATATAWSNGGLSSGDESRCRTEMQRHSMDSCRNFMKYGRQTQQQMLMMEVDDDENDEMAAPRECCNQLRRVSTECRCPIIRNMMQQIIREEQGGRQQNDQCSGGRCGEMLMRGRLLPAMCNMEPHSCRMQGAGY